MSFKVIQGHRDRYQSKARMRLPISDYYQLTSYLVPFRNYRILLFKFWTLCVFEPPLGDLGTTYDVHLWFIGKRVVDFLLVLIELFSLGVMAEALRAKINLKNRRFKKGVGQHVPNFHAEGDVLHQSFLHG